MRTVLGVLRSSEQDSDGPQPGLDRIPELVERARESGVDLDVVCLGDPPPLSPGQALVAHRIVQEALTNVLKHAGQVRAGFVALLGAQPDIEVVGEAADRDDVGDPRLRWLVRDPESKLDGGRTKAADIMAVC